MSLHSPPPTVVDGRAFRVGIVAARYNPTLVDALLKQAESELRAHGVKSARMETLRVPGSNELPSAVQLLLRKRRLDVVVALGVIIRGETSHYELVAQAATQGLQQVSLEARVPVIAGIVVAETEAQAKARCLGKIDRGAEFARAALDMAALKKSLSQ